MTYQDRLKPVRGTLENLNIVIDKAHEQIGKRIEITRLLERYKLD